MDSLSADRGQAVVVAALLIGIGALAIVSLRVVQERVLASAVTRAVGEAAVEAAAAAVADAYVVYLAHLRTRAFESPAPTLDVPRLLADPATLESARAAAAEVAARNGGTAVGAIVARCDGRAIEITLLHDGRLHRASLQADACSPR